MEPTQEGPPEEPESVSPGAEAILVLITCATPPEAERIARELVEQRLAACVNVVPHVRSFFSWENTLSEEEEVLLVVKTRRSRFRQLTVSVKTLHSYSVPEIIAVPIVEGSARYLKWIDDVTS